MSIYSEDDSLHELCAELEEEKATLLRRLAEMERALRLLRKAAYATTALQVKAHRLIDNALNFKGLAPPGYVDPEPQVTYCHQKDPKGIRFRQYKKDALPPWAVDVRDEPAEGADREEPPIDCFCIPGSIRPDCPVHEDFDHAKI